MTWNRSWNVLSWNVRGINSQTRWNAIKSKISESNSDIICLQETKRESFNDTYIQNFCPPTLDQFDFTPSTGNSGCTLIVWNKKLKGEPIFQNNFAHSVEFQCKLYGAGGSSQMYTLPVPRMGNYFF